MSPAVLSVLLIVFAAHACASRFFNNRLNSGPLLMGLSETEKVLVVRIHNEFRNKVAKGDTEGQPPAANMEELVWSDEAADITGIISDVDGIRFQNIVNGQDGDPRFGHNDVRFSYNNSRPVDDERIAESLVAMVTSWYDEHKNFKFGERNSQPTSDYVQLVNAETWQVGCRFVVYRVPFLEDLTYYYLSCRYYRKMENRLNPYITGTRDCGKYNLQNSTMYSDLCAK